MKRIFWFIDVMGKKRKAYECCVDGHDFPIEVLQEQNTVQINEGYPITSTRYLCAGCKKELIIA